MKQQLSVLAAISSLVMISTHASAKPAASPDQKLEWLSSTLAKKDLGGKNSANNPFGKPMRTYKGEPQGLCLNDEATSFTIERSVVNVWAQSWKARDFAAFQSLLADKATLPEWKTENRETNSPVLTVKDMKAAPSTGDMAFLKKYLSDFTKIDDVELDFVSFNNHPDTPVKHNPAQKVSRAKLLVRFDIRGTQKSEKRNDRGTFEVQVVDVAGAWKIQGITLLTGESVASSKVFFEESTKQASLDKVPTYIRREAIRRGGYALAVADYNNDKILDLFMGNDVKSVLLKGNKDGTFTEDASTPVSAETSVKTAMFADLNNDGWQDLTLVKFVSGKTNSITVYHNHDGMFTASTHNPEPNSPDYAMPAAIGDFNTDGFLDLYVGFPGVKDFTNLDFNYGKVAAKKFNKTPHGLYMNDKKGDLTEARSYFANKKAAFVENSTNMQYPHSAIAVDYDNDGLQDLVVMDDRGNLSPVFKNLGKGQFAQVADKIGVSNEGYGMGVAVADFNNDGLMDMVMTNVDFTAAHRMINSCKENQEESLHPNLFARGFVAFKNMGNGKFADVTKASGLEWIGQGAGGTEFVDFDNDGWQDIYVVNGLWSGTDKYEDIASLYSRAVLTGLAWDRPEIDFGRSTIMSILADHNGPLMKNEAGKKLSMAGFQHNRLFRNNHDGTFTEMGYVAGVDAIADGYVVAKADLNKDGNTDLILRNADPGTKENTFAPLQVFMNQGATKQKSVTVQLIGKSSNRDGVGAKVTAWAGKEVIAQELIANNGAAQGEKVIHIGLGSESKISKLEVQWPSGLKSQLSNVKAGFITIEEPTSTELGSL